MFDTLITGWKHVYATYLEGGIGRIMYYYLTSAVVIIGILYLYLYYQGTLAIALLFSVWAGAKLSTTQPPITIVQAIGIILIIRYTLLGAIDAVAKKVPDKIDERLIRLEDKVHDIHKLSFQGFLEADRVTELKREIKDKKKATR